MIGRAGRVSSAPPAGKHGGIDRAGFGVAAGGPGQAPRRQRAGLGQRRASLTRPPLNAVMAWPGWLTDGAGMDMFARPAGQRRATVRAVGKPAGVLSVSIAACLADVDADIPG